MALVFAIIFAFLIAGLLGTKRKIGFGWSLAACLLLSPLLGLIITLCSGKLPEGQPSEEVSDEKPLADVLAEAGKATEETTGESVASEEPTPVAEQNEDSSVIDY